MTPTQIELARHALGLPNKNKRSYRNRFIAGEYHEDFRDWETMVNCGWAEKYNGKGLNFSGDHMYLLNIHGATMALKKRESLCKEDFPTTDSKDEAGK